MRVWDSIEPTRLCRKHLLAEHNEIHVIWRQILKLDHGEKAGWRHHPEIQRWRQHTAALEHRHQQLVEEFDRRGYQHKSPLEPQDLRGSTDDHPEPYDDQEHSLQRKECDCKTITHGVGWPE